MDFNYYKICITYLEDKFHKIFTDVCIAQTENNFSQTLFNILCAIEDLKLFHRLNAINVTYYNVPYFIIITTHLQLGQMGHND